MRPIENVIVLPPTALHDQLAGFPLLIILGVAAAGIISWYFVNFNYTYNDALKKVADYANFNYWKREVPWYNHPLFFDWPNRYDTNFVQNVVNCYMNLVLDNDKLPEYSAYSESIQRTLFTEMSKLLPYSIKDMQYIMNAVDYAVSDGSVKIIAMKLPRTTQNNQRMYQQPKIVQEEIQKYNETRDKGLIEQATDLLSTIGIVAGVIGVAAGTWILYNMLPKQG